MFWMFAAGQDSLMPLTQLTSLRQELRSARFCQPAVALLLQPFPRLRADLLDAWFDRAGTWSPEALAQWAAAPGAMCLGFQHWLWICSETDGNMRFFMGYLLQLGLLIHRSVSFLTMGFIPVSWENMNAMVMDSIKTGNARSSIRQNDIFDGERMGRSTKA
jgi:hypothetical protein